MSVSRRRFLKKGTVAVLAAGCALGRGLSAFGQDLIRTQPALDFQIPYEATQSPVFYYTRETFEPYVGGAFRSRHLRDGGSVFLQLLKVRAYAPASGTRLTTGDARETRSFTLTFQAGRPLAQHTGPHTLEHAALGKFPLQMARTIDSRGRVFYEAVISHVV